MQNKFKIKNFDGIEDLITIILVVITYTSFINYLEINQKIKYILYCVFFLSIFYVSQININKITINTSVIIVICACLYLISDKGLTIHLNIDEALYMNCSRAIVDGIKLSNLEGLNSSCFYVHHRWGLPLLGSQIIKFSDLLNFFNINNFLGYLVIISIGVACANIYKNIIDESNIHTYFLIIFLTTLNINLNFMRIEGQLPNLFGIFFMINIIKLSLKYEGIINNNHKFILIGINLVGVSLFFNDLLLLSMLIILLLNIKNYKYVIILIIYYVLLISPIFKQLFFHITNYQFNNAGYVMPYNIRIPDMIGINYYYRNFFELIDFSTKKTIKSINFLNVLNLIIFFIVLNSKKLYLILGFIFIYFFNIYIELLYINSYVLFKINSLFITFLILIISMGLENLKQFKFFFITNIILITLINFSNLLYDYNKHKIYLTRYEVISIINSNSATKNCIINLRPRINSSTSSYLIQRNYDFIMTSLINNLIVDDTEGLIGGSFAMISNLQGNQDPNLPEINKYNICALGINRYDKLNPEGKLIYSDAYVTVREYNYKFSDITSDKPLYKNKLFLN